MKISNFLLRCINWVEYQGVNHPGINIVGSDGKEISQPRWNAIVDHIRSGYPIPQ